MQGTTRTYAQIVESSVSSECSDPLLSLRQNCDAVCPRWRGFLRGRVVRPRGPQASIVLRCLRPVAFQHRRGLRWVYRAVATTWWQRSKEMKGRGEETEETGTGTVERRNQARRDAPRRVGLSFRAGLFVPTRHQRSSASCIQVRVQAQRLSSLLHRLYALPAVSEASQGSERHHIRW